MKQKIEYMNILVSTYDQYKIKISSMYILSGILM